MVLAFKENRSAWLVGLLLLAAVGYNLIVLYPEVAVDAPDLNDNVLHYALVERAVEALERGEDPTDPWVSYFVQGYPLFHHYQHLPHLVTAIVYKVSAGVMSLRPLFLGLSYLLLSTFPLSVYWTGRRLGFGVWPAALSGVAASLLSTNGLYGLDWASYVWRGYGMYTQLWGMWLLGPALAGLYVTLHRGRCYAGTAALLAATLLSHTVLGYVALLSGGLLVLLEGRAGIRQRLGRLLWVLLLVAVAASYFLVPFALDRTYMNRSVWEDPGKYDAYGWKWTLGALFKGELLDSGRFPSLTLLAGLGLLVCLFRWREGERYRLWVTFSGLWLLLYFGRPTWGVLLNLLPLSQDLHLHRLIAPLHLGAIGLVGVGLAWLWEWALALPAAVSDPAAEDKPGLARWWAWFLARRRWWSLAAVGLLVVVLLGPAYRERIGYAATNADWKRQNAAAFQADGGALEALLADLRTQPPARVYAGRAANWGNDYRVGSVPVYALLAANQVDNPGYLYHALSFNADIEGYLDEGRLATFNLFNLGYVIAPEGQPVPDFAQPLRSYGRHHLYQVETSGYFDLVDSDLALYGERSGWFEAARAWLWSGQVEAKQHPLIVFGDEPLVSVPAMSFSAAPGTLSGLSYPQREPCGRLLSEGAKGNTYAVAFQADRACWLLFKATFHPGWQATLDGQPVSVQMLAPSFLGIQVEPGQHFAVWTYQPSRLQAWLRIIGAGVVILAAVAEWQRERWKVWIARARPFLVGLRTALSPAKLTQRWRSTRARARSRVGLKTKLGIYLLFLSIYLVTSAGHFFGTDHVAVYLVTESLVKEQSLAIKPILDTVTGPDGKAYSVFGVGQSLLSIPLYLIGSAVDRISPPALQRYWSGVPLGDWGGTVPIFFVSLFNQLITPLICLLVFLFCLELGFSRKRSFLVTLAYGLGTAAWVYARGYFQHPLETLLLLLSVYLLFRQRDQLLPKHALLAGGVFAYGLLTRVYLFFLFPLLLIYLFYLVHKRTPAGADPPSAPEDQMGPARPPAGRRFQELLRGAKDAWPHLLAFSLPVVLVLALVLQLNRVRFGDYLVFNPVISARGWVHPIWAGLYGNLLSLGRSIFLYSPPTILALVAFGRFYRHRRGEAILFGSIVGMYFLVYSLSSYWHGGWSWGPRFLLATIPFLMIPLAYFLDSVRNGLIVVLLALLGVGVQILGVVINYSYVHWDWLRMNLVPEIAFLFQPDISPIPTHLQALLEGRYIDLWLLEVYKGFGLGIFLVTLAVPVFLLVWALTLLRPTKVGRVPARERIQFLHFLREGLRRRYQALRGRLGPHLPFLVGVLLITLLAGLPTLQLKVMSGHDTFEYLPRTIEFYRVLEEGQIFPRWAPDLSRGYGQPFFLFNPPLIYYAASVFHALGASVVASLDLACLALLALAGVGMYAFAQEFFGRAGGLASAAAYVLAPFTLINLYVRHAFADYAAMAFIPWALWGLCRWVRSWPAQVAQDCFRVRQLDPPWPERSPKRSEGRSRRPGDFPALRLRRCLRRASGFDSAQPMAQSTLATPSDFETTLQVAGQAFPEYGREEVDGSEGGQQAVGREAGEMARSETSPNWAYLLVAVVAVALLMLSSNPVALVAVPVLGAYVLFLAWSARAWRPLGQGLWALGLGLGLSAFFWLPALLERDWVKTGELLAGYLNYRNHFVYLQQLIHSPWGYGLSLPGSKDEMSFGLGWTQLVLLATSILLAWLLRRRLSDDRLGRAHLWFFVALLGLVVFLVTTLSTWLWDLLPLLQYLEFPWRILVLAALATAFVCGFPFLVVRGKGRPWLLVAVLAGILLVGMPRANPEGYYETSDAEFAPEVIAAQGLAVTTRMEYEPVWVERQPEAPAPASRLLLLGGQVRVLESRLSGTRYEWLVEAAGPAQLRVATFYYPGWQLFVDGRPRLVQVLNPYGLMDFTLEAGTHRLVMTFGLTPWRRWAGGISLGALGLVVLTGLWPRIRREG